MKLKLSERLGYSAGYFSISIFNDTISIYLLAFFTNLLGLSPLVAGNIFLVARIWDAINDPMMGTLADRTRSKWGSYRPYILFGALPLCVFFILCFSAPEMSMGAKIAWALVVYIGEGMLGTLVGMPYGTLPNAMTTDMQERAVLGVGRSMGSAISGIVISVFAMRIVNWVGHGEETAQGYQVMAIVFAVLAFIGFMLCFTLVKERVPASPKKINLKQGFMSLKGNTPAYSIFLITFLFIMAISFRMSFNVYYFLYVIGDMDLMSVIMLVIYGVQLVTLFVVPKMIKSLGKRRMMLVGASMTILSGIFFLIAHSNVVLLFIAAIFCGLCMSFSISVIWGTLADVADYGEWKTGIRAPAFLYTIASFFLKCGGAMASWLSGLILTIVGFQSAEFMQSEATVNGLYWANGLFPIILGILAVIVILTYRLNDQRLAEIIAELKVRREKND